MKPQIIREKLRQWVEATGEHREGDVFIDELCIIDKTNRADLVHANGRLCGFEIKSEADTLKRWPDQRTAYKLIFDEVWICCHRKHAPHILLDEEDDSGIIIIDDYGSLAVLRPAKHNRHTNGYHLTGLLWRGELDSLCRQHNLPVIRSEKIKDARQRVATSLPLEVVRNAVLAVLKDRYKTH
jgi:hypothetical protein